MPLIRIVDAGNKRHYAQKVTAEPNDTNGATSGRRAINVRDGAQEVLMRFEGAEGRIGLCPRITAVLFYDASAASWTDLLGANKAILNSSQTGMARFTMDASDFLYIASVDRIGGFRLDLDATLLNNDASTGNLDYSAPGGFVNTTITDGSATGGATLGVDGNVTITTVPADGTWAAVALSKVVAMSEAAQRALPEVNVKRYWCRFYATAITGPPLDEVEIEQLIPFVYDKNAANTADAAGGLIFIQSNTEYTEDLNEDVGAIEYQSDETTTQRTFGINWLYR